MLLELVLNVGCGMGDGESVGNSAGEGVRDGVDDRFELGVADTDDVACEVGETIPVCC